MPAFEEWFEFNENTYRARMQSFAKNGQHQEIQKREVEKYQHVYGASAKIATGVGASFVLGPGGLVPTAIGSRQLYVARKKLDILREVMKEHGIPELTKTTKDKIVPVTTSVVSSSVGWMVGGAADHIIQAGAEGAMAAGVQPAVHHGVEGTINSLAHDPSGFLSGAVHGAHEQVAQMSALAHPTEIAAHSAQETIQNAWSPTMGDAFSDGAIAGHAAMQHVEQMAAQAVVTAIIDEKFNKDAREEVALNQAGKRSDVDIRKGGKLRSWQKALAKTHEDLQASSMRLKERYTSANNKSQQLVARFGDNNPNLMEHMLQTKTAHGELCKASTYSELCLASMEAFQSTISSWSSEGWWNELNTWQVALEDQSVKNKVTAEALSKWETCLERISNQAIAKFAFNALEPGDLGFQKGQIITIIKRTKEDTNWWTGRIGDREGIFPRYVNYHLSNNSVVDSFNADVRRVAIL
jgi:hypothetical protein